MDGLPWQYIGPSTGWIIVIGLIVAFFRGKVWTDAAYQEKVHEANEWRTESRIKDAQLAEKDRQLRHMREVGRLVGTLAVALQQSAGIHVDTSILETVDDDGST